MAFQPINDELGEKRKLERMDEKELPATKKIKKFQRDIRLFINTGVYATLNQNVNEINSRNLAEIETRPPFQDMNEGLGVGTEEETQCVAKAASADCEYSIGVGTPGQHAIVTIPHEMRLGTGDMQPGEATKNCDNLNIVIGTPIQHLAVTTTNNLEFGTADLTQGVATLVCASRSPYPTESGGGGDNVQRLNIGLGNVCDRVETGLVRGLASRNGVGTGNLTDMRVVTEGMIESVVVVRADDKLGPNVMPDKTQKHGFGTANLEEGLATAPNKTPKPNQIVTGAPDTIRNGIDVESVILRNVVDLKSLCGSPKTAKFKPPQKVSKVTLPDWLIKWQKLSNEQPPQKIAKKKLTLIIPPEQKEETKFPKSANSKKIANQKAKKEESGQKKHHQSAKKIKKNNAEKITSQETNPVPVSNVLICSKCCQKPNLN